MFNNMLLTTVLSMMLQPAPPQELYKYLQKPDTSFEWKVYNETTKSTILELTSQTWQGMKWKHALVFVRPKSAQVTDTAVLLITGGDPNQKDLDEMQLVAELSGMPFAILFDIPNQPIEGRSEDDLISHTLLKYLETKDASWPLLFPMTKSVIRAMDALQSYTLGHGKPIRNFVVTGASKRGWTTWLAGASQDKRIIGIAPMVIDNLNISTQMSHQLQSWGKFSEQIDDYTQKGLMEKLTTREGKHLSQMIDPYSYRSNINIPTLILNAGNDAYWTVDALNNYWSDLTQPKWLRIVPNVPHNLGDKKATIEIVGAFARSLAYPNEELPQLTWSFEQNTLKVTSKGRSFSSFTIWQVESPTLDFRDQSWQPVASQVFPKGETSAELEFPWPDRRKNCAVFGELKYQVNGRNYSLTTQVEIVKPPC